ATENYATFCHLFFVTRALHVSTCDGFRAHQGRVKGRKHLRPRQAAPRPYVRGGDRRDLPVGRLRPCVHCTPIRSLCRPDRPVRSLVITAAAPAWTRGRATKP